MKLEVVQYGDPVLQQKAEPVEEVDDAMRELVENMLETVEHLNGLGLAAQQIGETMALCVVTVGEEYDVNEEDGIRENPDVGMPLVMLNPEITAKSGECTMQEGCLSCPGIYVPITRPEQVTVEYQDFEMVKQSVDVKGLLARAVQHEIDHLNGVLITQRMSPVKRVSLAGKLRSLKKESLAKLEERSARPSVR